MRSTFGGFNTVVRGIFANQTALDTTGHNVSNASADGYSRQLVNMSTANPETVYGGAYGAFQIGSGVEIQSIERARESLIDKQIWKEAGSLSYSTNKQNLLAKVEGAFGDPGTTGLQTVMNTFWKSWQDLATHASDDGSRTVVREDGVALTNAMQHSAQQLKNLIGDLNDVIKTRVDKINEITSQVSQLNKKIFQVEASGTDHANDLKDQRDNLIDQLSSIIDTKVTEDKNGNYIVQTGCGYVLADATSSTRLAVDTVRDEDYGYYKSYVMIAGSSPKQYVDFKDGEIKSLIDTRDSEKAGLKGYLNTISTMSEYLLKDFNAVHRAGYAADNSTGNNFFGQLNSDYKTTTIPAGTYQKDYWISQLQVNSVITDPGGIAKIAAKTGADSITVTKSNTNGGNAAITSATGTYTQGTNATSVEVTITADAAGNPTGISYRYSSDKGTTWSTAVTQSGSGPYNFSGTTSINGISFTLTIPSDPDNKTNDKFTFSLSQGNMASGDNALKLCEALKNNTSPILDNASLDGYYSAMIGGLGIQAQDAKRSMQTQQALVNQLDNQRQSVSGVNIDEEMTNMIRYQKGYNAAARVMTTMDEMLDKLINGTGTVGR